MMRVMGAIGVASLVVLLCPVLIVPEIVTAAEHEEGCQALCVKNTGLGSTLETKCDQSCKIEQCNKGCGGRERSLESSCKHFCVSDDGAVAAGGRWFCVIGCNIAVSRYVRQLKEELQLEAPTLVPDSVTPDSVTVRWMSQPLPHATLLVQYKMADSPGEWNFYRPEDPVSSSQATVAGLQPYTKYQFRVLWMLAADQEPVAGPASHAISTLARGRPSSPPSDVTASASDPHHVSVSWRPPRLPGGPVVSYLVQLSAAGGAAGADDLVAEVAGRLTSHVLGELKPSTEYTVKVSARNKEGVGPPAEVLVLTPPLAAEVSTQQKPQLVIGTSDVIMRLEMNILSSPDTLYRAEAGVDITGTALDIAASRLYFATSDSHIWRLPLDSGNALHDVTPDDVTPTHLAGAPLRLSLDWLAEEMYAVVSPSGGGWRVQKWPLADPEVEDTGLMFSSPPAHMAVDPQNGYLYYSMTSPAQSAGLYRCSLGNMTLVEPVSTAADLNFSTFAIDHTNVSVLVPGKERNTVFALSMTSWAAADIRQSAVRPQYAGMTALTQHARTLCWAAGQHLYLEAFRPDRGIFYNNRFSLQQSARRVVGLHVQHSGAQPIPAPPGPPRHLQVVFHSGRALARWRPPALSGVAGPAAWQRWTYQLRVSDGTTETLLQNVTQPEMTVHELRPDTAYTVQVRAQSPSGISTWSAAFVGRTLEHHLNASGPFLLWSTEIGLLRSDVIGERTTVLVSRASFGAPSRKNIHVSDLTWCDDVMYLATNDSRVYTHDLRSGHLRRLDDSVQATALAVDWLGKKLYWSNSVQQLIYSAPLPGNGTSDVTGGTPLPFVTAARHLRVDAIAGVLYWSTGHAVEASYLTGKHRKRLFQTGIFSGRQVVGLTLDLVGRRLFWIVREFSGSALHVLPLLDALDGLPDDRRVATVTPLQHKQVKGPLHFFSGRLLWVMDDESAVIADPDVTHLAVINAAGVSGLRMVAVLDSALHPLPDGHAAVSVLPERVDGDTIALRELSGGVEVTWNPVGNTDYGTVEYMVELNFTAETEPRTTDVAWLQVPGQRLPPFTPVAIAVRAVTRWGESPLTRVSLHSAEGVPSAPRRLRVYTHRARPVADPQNWKAVVRWDAPAVPGGRIRQYTVNVQRLQPDGGLFGTLSIPGNTTEARLTGLSGDTTYKVQVSARTSAGVGNSSGAQAFTPRDLPVPRLLVADADRLHLLDLDTSQVTDLLAEERVIDLDVDERDQKLFVLTADHDILSVDLNTLEKHKVESLRGNGTSIAYDWISRNLYWAEAVRSYNAIYRLNVDTEVADTSAERAVRVAGLSLSSGHIQRLRVDPWTSRLVWTMRGPNGASMMTSPARDGSLFGPFFPEDGSSNSCNCSSIWSGGGLVALHGRSSADRRLVMEGTTGQLLAADLDGCSCQAFATLPEDDGTMALTTDKLYWTSGGSSVFARSLTGQTASGDSRPLFSGRFVHGLWPLDGRLQTFPSADCLLPAMPALPPAACNNTASSVTLQMPPPSPPAGCGQVSAAPPQYQVHYGPSKGADGLCREHLRFCLNKTFSGSQVRLTGLQPLTAYTVRVSATNHYSRLLRRPASRGATVTVLTTAPAPTEPRQVHAVPLSPESIEVRWLPPLSSGDRLSYRVHWRTEGVSGSLRAYGPEAAAAGADPGLQERGYRLLVPDLTADTKYQIWVSAHSSDGSAASNSSLVGAATYPYPGNITLQAANISSIAVSWHHPADATVNQSWVEYRSASRPSDWRNCTLVSTESAADGALVSRHQASPLQARTDFVFRLRLVYRSGQLFLWPRNGEFTFRTAGGRPDGPLAPRVRVLQGSVYQVTWPPPRTNGAPVDLYGLEVSSDQRSRLARSLDGGRRWRLVYNGSEPSWIVSGLDQSPNYRFRARAHNAYGWSPYSAESHPINLQSMPLTAQAPDTGVIVGGVVSAALLVISLSVVLLVMRFRRRPEDKKAPRSPDQLPHDLELAQLREIPAHFIRQNNALYAPPFTGAEEAGGLPRVRREHITLTKFLGKGAFGEVYEGLAQQLPGREDEEDGCRVAIKTLAKGAKDEEKLEFLKEAQLMSNFRHKHIISLLGVCLDNDPYFLLLELMEGGDLLSYLRASRGSDSDGTPILSLNDLLQMCVDVSRGCQYLEQLHFVHRDLAARNCLVTSADPRRRLVKIGDFGLARDIYKSDYYRKEGEGLLPVRWMAPESLIDGVFTSQSDVWAFGVLLWEVMTKGQQPYPARTNLEVLQYVREGGTLSRPEDCPQMLYELMQHCWEYEAEERPTFQYCLQCLQRTQVAALSQAGTLMRTGMTVHNAQYARTPGAFDNNAYTLDGEEATDDGGASWRRASSATSGGQDSSQLLPSVDGDADSVFSDGGATQSTLPSRARLRLPAQKHKYLQLRADSDAGGYEVPIGYIGVTDRGIMIAEPTTPTAALPHGYQNCAAAAETRVASPAATASAAVAGSVDDIQFSFVDAADVDNPRHSVASLLSQISGVAIDVDPGTTSWC